jgi:hypothetical protein
MGKEVPGCQPCFGCPRFFEGIDGEGVKKLAKKTAFDENRNLVLKRSGQEVGKHVGANKAWVGMCGPIMWQVEYVMSQNGGVEYYPGEDSPVEEEEIKL